MITAPGGAEASLAALAREDPGAAPVSRWIAAASPEAALFRADIYADMYFCRLCDILRDDYSKVLGLLGEGPFRTLVREYLDSHPSRYASVRHVGAHVPEFLKVHRFAKSLPYLENLAALEWARVEVFDRKDAAPIAPEALASLTPQEWPGSTFAPIPSFHLLRSAYPVHEIWMAIEKGREIPVIESAPTALAIWRQEFTVYHRPIEEQEAQGLELLAWGEPFAAICEALAEGIDGVAQAGEKAMLTLLQWVRDGMIAGFQAPPP